MSRQLTKIITVILLSLFTLSVFAQTPTPQQLEQFKNLSPAQQQQLARQLGVDLSRFTGSTTLQDSQEQDIPVGPYPRGTVFDAFGNPIAQEPNDLDILSADPSESSLKLYGIDLFANSPSTFSPVSDLPVPSSYLIGAGDELRVRLYGKENQDYLLQVDREGNVVIPAIGPFNVASLSFAEAKSYLANQIKERIIGVDVSITMGKLRSMRVFVMGEAHKPGAYTVSSLSTITHALFVSGGMTDIASLRNIQLKRSGKLVTTLDLYDLLNEGDSSNDVLLQPGDVVFIPPVEKTVSIDGEVRRPAIYELKNENSLQEVIKLAGGQLPGAYTGALSIQRFVSGSQIQITADLFDQNVTAENGDVIDVPKVSPVVSNSVTLIGAVARPGKYQWQDGMRLSDLIDEPQKDVLEIADLTYVIVVRDKNLNKDIEVIQTDLLGLNTGSNEADLILHNNDRVLVFSKIESEVLGDIDLNDLAFTQSEIEQKEKEAWRQRIQEKLFWESIGLSENSEQFETEELEEVRRLQSQTIIELTKQESERVLEYRDTTYFSRKRMLAPVIAKLREQAKFGAPLQLVEVAGEVKIAGIYPLAMNASVKDMLVAAGGLTEASYPRKSEITRTMVTASGASEIQHIEFSPAKVFSGEASQKIKVESKDRINVFSLPSWQEELKIKVVGEVQFPGEYSIRRGEKLSDLVERVGGLTEYGDADAVVFTRASLRVQERKNLQSLAHDLRKQIASESLRRNNNAGSIVSYEESRKLLGDLTKVEAVGRLVIDFNEVLAGVQSADITLEDGDTLYVPGRSQTVNVIGEVYVPTSHLFAESMTVDEYIARSGGYRALADKSNTYIIRANGAVTLPNQSNGFWFSEDSKQVLIKPGDTIVIPFDADNVDNMTLWANATQVLYQLAAAIAAIGSL